MCTHIDYKSLSKDSKDQGYTTLGSCDSCGMFALLRQVADPPPTDKKQFRRVLALCGYCYDGWKAWKTGVV